MSCELLPLCKKKVFEDVYLFCLIDLDFFLIKNLPIPGYRVSYMMGLGV